MTLSGQTRLYCVIGNPVAHSLSPFIMNRAFAEHGIDAAYGALTVPGGRVREAIQGLRELGAGGVNVTHPHKTSVLDTVDRSSPAVDVIGAANTLALTTTGIVAHNTDAPGAARALRKLGGVAVADRRILIFGGGGAARAAAYGLLDEGAAAVTLAVREPSRVGAFVRALREHFATRGVEAVSMRASPVEKVDIVINATPVGMVGWDGTSLLEGKTITSAQCLFDFVYHPLDTEFLEQARRAGAHAVDGLALLVTQAQESFYLWTGKRFSLTDMVHAVRDHMASNDTTTQMESKG